MGSGSWDSSKWDTFKSASVAGKSTAAVFTSRDLEDDLNPLNFKNGIRESVDSPDNPLSTPVAIFSDCTGSMGPLAHAVIQKLDVVCEELLERKPVTDVHLLTGVVGDAFSDRAPLQCTQFEADNSIADQTKRLFIEGGGGANYGESYALPWLFASMMTATDCYDKRGKKGYLFTVGDEPILGVETTNVESRYRNGVAVTKEQAKRFLGLDIERDLSANELLAMAERRWNVFHIVVTPHGRRREGVEESWGALMPDRLIYLQDIASLPEVIVSAIQVAEGEAADKVAASWTGSTSLAVADALKNLAARDAAGAEVVRL